MKKIGLLVMALVLALGALGVGYAMWSDTVTISGTVNTGTLDLVVKEYSSTYVWKLADHGIAVVHNSDTAPEGAIDWDGDANGTAVTPVAYAYAEEGDDIDDIHVVIDNAFPLETDNLTADFLLHYEGSIPVRVQLAELEADPDLSPFLKIMFYDSNASGDKLSGAYGPEAIMGDQWHNCKYVLVEIYFDSELLQAANWEGTPDGGTLGGMGLSADITGTITVVQWNEYEEPNG